MVKHKVQYLALKVAYISLCFWRKTNKVTKQSEISRLKGLTHKTYPASCCAIIRFAACKHMKIFQNKTNAKFEQKVFIIVEMKFRANKFRIHCPTNFLKSNRTTLFDGGHKREKLREKYVVTYFEQ